MGITKTWRREAPGSYSLKLVGYSNLKKNLSIPYSYESATFAAYGYQWRMILYPCGNKRERGGNHISIYARLETPVSDLPENWKIHAELKFFVLDQIQMKYLTVQDGVVKHYSEARKEFGIARVIKLSTLHDQKNGYVVNDTLIFGVEISLFVPTNETVTILQNPPDNIFTWKILHFSILDKQYFLSDEFLIGQRYWRMRMDPREDEKGVSTYLIPSTRLPNSIVASSYASFKLKILNQRNSNHVEYTVVHFFEADFDIAGGRKHIISHEDLYDQSKGFLVNDAIVLELEMLCVSQTKASKLDDFLYFVDS